MIFIPPCGLCGRDGCSWCGPSIDLLDPWVLRFLIAFDVVAGLFLIYIIGIALAWWPAFLRWY